MERCILKYEEDFCCNVNDFLESQGKILFVKCKNPENCKKLLHSMETDKYIFTDLFYNVSRPEHLLFLLRQQKNPKKVPSEYSWFLGYGKESSSYSYGINPAGLINSIRNLFQKDLLIIKEQIVDCLKNLGKKIAVLLYVKDDISNQLKILIDDLCSDTNCLAKFIFIYKSNIFNNLLYLCNKYVEFNNKLYLNYNSEQLQQFFPLFSVEQINDMLIATDEDIEEMNLIYAQVCQSSNTNSNGYIDSLIRSSLGQTCDENSKRILGVAAHLFEKFSVDEICEICNKASINSSYDIIDEVLDKNYTKGIIDVSAEEYIFLSKNIKKAFADMFSRISKRLHSVIYNYLTKNKPFEYQLRRAHAKLAQNYQNETNLIAMELCNACHFSKQPNISILQDFNIIFGENIKNALINTYKNLIEGNYCEAKNNCLVLCESDNLVLQHEMKYLCALIDWKIGDSNKNITIQNSLSEIISSQDAEVEIVILAEMLMLSVISNLGEYARNITKTTPFNIFNSIKSKVSNYDCCDSDFLKHVLYRKSCSAQPRALALKYVGESFEYFKDRMELYYEEYLEAGVNLLAMQIESLDRESFNNMHESKELCENPYLFANSLADDYENCQSKQIKAYFKNNYLLAKFFFDKKHLTEDEVNHFYSETNNVNLDSKIMFTMNVGTFFACFNKYEKARAFWEKAKSLNSCNDDYFDYIISSNEYILDICEGKINDCKILNVPALFCNDSELRQYIDERNDLIKQLTSTKISYTYNEIQEIFAKRFEEKFKGSNLAFYSIPFLFSDVQFWSEN